MRNLVITMAFLISISSCKSTELIGSWKVEQAPTRNYSEIGIVVVTPNMSTRSIMESDLATVLATKGIKASPTFDIFPFVANRELFDENDTLSIRNYARERIDKFGFDAILLVALFDQRTESRYNQGSTFSFAVPAYQYNYYGFYQYAYSTVHTPGYYSTKTLYFLESNLYDAGTEKLIWTAQTKTTVDVSDIHKDSRLFADIIAEEMLKKNAVTP